MQQGWGFMIRCGRIAPYTNPASPYQVRRRIHLSHRHRCSDMILGNYLGRVPRSPQVTEGLHRVLTPHAGNLLRTSGNVYQSTYPSHG